MNRYSEEEKIIQDLISGTSLPLPPKSALQNFEDRVWEKTHSLPRFPVPSPALTLALAAGAAVLVAAVMLLMPVAEKDPAVVMEPVELSVPVNAGSETLHEPVDTVTAPSEERTSTVSEAEAPVEIEVSPEEFEEIAREILILELLGEDEGLFNDSDRLAVDMEVWSEVAALPGVSF